MSVLIAAQAAARRTFQSAGEGRNNNSPPKRASQMSVFLSISIVLANMYLFASLEHIHHLITPHVFELKLQSLHMNVHER